MSDRDNAFRRHEASMHEAGHVVMWRVLGFPNADGHIWPEPEAYAGYGQTDGPWWAGRATPNRRHATDSLGSVQVKMIGVAGSVAQMLYRWRTINDDAYQFGGDWLTFHMSESDWALGQYNMLPTRVDAPDPLWRRAITLVQKRFDPEMIGDLWPDLCRTAAHIRRHALTGPPGDGLMREAIKEAKAEALKT